MHAYEYIHIHTLVCGYILTNAMPSLDRSPSLSHILSLFKLLSQRLAIYLSLPLSLLLSKKQNKKNMKKTRIIV